MTHFCEPARQLQVVIALACLLEVADWFGARLQNIKRKTGYLIDVFEKKVSLMRQTQAMLLKFFSS